MKTLKQNSINVVEWKRIAAESERKRRRKSKLEEKLKTQRELIKFGNIYTDCLYQGTGSLEQST